MYAFGSLFSEEAASHLPFFDEGEHVCILGITDDYYVHVYAHNNYKDLYIHNYTCIQSCILQSQYIQC